MDEYETLNHTTWDCKYHVVFILVSADLGVLSFHPEISA
jgi:hypothetical protein